MNAPRPRPLVLCLLDGLGEREDRDGNAVRLAKTPALDALAAYPRTLLGASGADVGLPPRLAGNAEVGSACLGAGRVLASDRARIDAVVGERALDQNQIVADTIRIAKHHFAGRLHLVGLLSDGGVHSALSHLFALIDVAHFEDVPVVVHAILDGRDGSPRGGGALIERLEHHLDRGRKGAIGTIGGRSFAMDRDGRWDRVQKAYQAIVRGPAPRADTALGALAKAYEAGKSDEHVEPVRVGDYSGIKGSLMCDFGPGGDRLWRWFGEENGFVFSHRTERLRQLSAMLLRKEVPPEVAEGMLTDRGKEVYAFIKGAFAGLTEVDPALAMPAAFPRVVPEGTLGEALAAAGLTQLRCAESEVMARVTTFFDGALRGPLPGEERASIPSPREVPSFEAATAAVAARVVAAVERGEHDFILVSLAGADLVAHTGKIDPTIRAVEAVDAGLGAIHAAVRARGGALLCAATHGNAERMKDANGHPWPAHTTSPVPLVYANDADREVGLATGGRLADVAPTVLSILGLPQPAAMTGRSLLVR